MSQAQKLLNWINTHDCGVSPCGVMNADESITIRVAIGHTAEHEETTVRTLTEARNVLGY